VRLVVWNCCLRVRENLPLLAALEPDVAVVPESAAPAPGADPTTHVAQGPNPSKGLSVFAYGSITLEALAPRVPWVLPVMVKNDDPFLLLAVWTVQRPGEPTYAKQISLAIDAYEQELAAGTAVLAGDFNCSGNTADPRPHLRNVDRLADLGLRSAYHQHHGCAPGAEPVGTLYWRWKATSSFHCDLVFIPEAWTTRVRTVEVGSFEDWVLAGRSDHCPVTVELAPGPGAGHP
jgi:hypothetical protein